MSDRLQTANWLVKALNQRAETILKVAIELAKQQAAFFHHGIAHLRPLVLSAMWPRPSKCTKARSASVSDDKQIHLHAARRLRTEILLHPVGLPSSIRRRRAFIRLGALLPHQSPDRRRTGDGNSSVRRPHRRSSSCGARVGIVRSPAAPSLRSISATPANIPSSARRRRKKWRKYMVFSVLSVWPGGGTAKSP